MAEYVISYFRSKIFLKFCNQLQLIGEGLLIKLFNRTPKLGNCRRKTMACHGPKLLSEVFRYNFQVFAIGQRNLKWRVLFQILAASFKVFDQKILRLRPFEPRVFYPFHIYQNLAQIVCGHGRYGQYLVCVEPGFFTALPGCNVLDGQHSGAVPKVGNGIAK